MRGQCWSSPLSGGLLTLSMPTAYSPSLLGMLPSSPYLSSLSLLPSACHHAPLTSLHSRAAYPIPPLSCPRVLGWLLCDKISNGGHLRPSAYFIFVIFSLFNLPPQNKKNTRPIHSTPAVHPLHHPSYCCRGLLVDCCVLGPIADTVHANGIFIVLTVLVVVIFVTLSLPSRSPNVLAWSRGLSHPPSTRPACFWLIIA
jgi:hypothetical protein